MKKVNVVNADPDTIHILGLLVLASVSAVLAWFILYKIIYKESISSGLPGEGIFENVIWKDPGNTKPLPLQDMDPPPNECSIV